MVSPLSNPVVRALSGAIATVPPGHRITLSTLRVTIARRSGDVSLDEDDRRVLHDLLEDPFQFTATVCSTPVLHRLAYRHSDTVAARRRWTPEERAGAVLDINNLLWTFRPPGRFDTVSPEDAVRRIVEAVDRLRAVGVETIRGVADASIRSLVNPADGLASRLDGLEIAPSGTPADEIILAAVSASPTLIVSNDRFREWRRRTPGVRRALWRLRVPLVVADGSWSFGDPERELADPIAAK